MPTVTVRQLNPQLTPFREGRTLTASSWRSHDTLESTPIEVGGLQLLAFPGGLYGIRRIYHYSTHMATIYFGGDGSYTCHPVSVGWGSVSDQKGMNQILGGCGWSYRRAGGAQYLESNTYDTSWHNTRVRRPLSNA